MDPLRNILYRVSEFINYKQMQSGGSHLSEQGKLSF